MYNNEILKNNKKEINSENKNILKNFVNDEMEKQNLSENDQYHMIMQLIKCGYDNEKKNIKENNYTDEYENLAKYKWKLIAKYVKNLWSETPTNKYQTVMAKITSLNIWDMKFNLDRLDDDYAEKTKKIIKKKDLDQEKNHF